MPSCPLTGFVIGTRRESRGETDTSLRKRRSIGFPVSVTTPSMIVRPLGNIRSGLFLLRKPRDGEPSAWPIVREFALFWFAAILLTLVVLTSLALPLFRRDAAVPSRAAHDLEVYGAQLRELEGDLRRGTLQAADAGAARAELGRRLLRAAADTDRTGGTRSAAGRLAPLVGSVALLAAGAGALLVYDRIGRPDLPALPLTARLGEHPIIFENRRAGKSKVNPKEAARSILMILWLGATHFFGLEDHRRT